MPGESRKRYIYDTHRLRDPAQTLAKIRPHLAQMGITRVANLTGLDRVGLPTVMATRPNSRSVAVSLGKGLSLAAAEVSGVMEAIETWHAERIDLPVRRASYVDMSATLPVVNAARLPRVSGCAFDPHRKIFWIEGTDLIGGAPCWVPVEMVDTDYTELPNSGHGMFPRTTNGLASGNDLSEATCHAICEVIERDATTLWHFLNRPFRINPETIHDARCSDALQRFQNAGLNVGIWETTSDVGVACFRCAVCEADDVPGHVGIGDGCHPDRNIAMLRALTEAAQTRLTYISGARDDLQPSEFTASALAAKSRYIKELIAKSAPKACFQDCPTTELTTFDDDLSWLLGRLAEAGIEQVVSVDLTRSEIGISVVRVIIPGLEAPHDDPDFIAGPRARRIEAVV